MGSWTSLVVLALAAVSTLSFPRPDSAYKIPTVGQGRRSQYYVLHSDGTYKYGYDTLEGAYEQAMAKTPGRLTGGFGYKDPTGADIKLEYTADDRGFIPKGSHLPVAPEVPAAPAVPAVPEPAAPAVHSLYTAPEPAPVAPAVYEVAEIASSSGDDGSYSFSYKNSDSSRSESGDANNAVAGTYSYITDDGVDHSIQYTANAVTGYIARGSSLPKGPSVPGAESGTPTGHILPVLTEEEANALAGATYTAGVPESPAITYSVDESPSDASYSFSYDAGDSSRSESADANLNVKGTFSFIPPDLGEKLTVNYIAGSETGFVAEGDHLPKPEDLGFGTKLTEIPEAPSAPAVPAKPAGTVLTYSAGDSPSDASYSFSYDAGSSSRSETSDSNLNIQGSYSFVAPDTEHRYNVKYHAGADTGFIAEGDHLPVAPEVPVIPPVPAVPEPVAPVAHSLYTAPEPAPQHTGDAAQTIYEVAKIASSLADDGSYSFSYKNSDSSRSESGDANNAVAGTYSYITDDGVDHSIQYTANADTGYIARGSSLPKGPSVPGAESGTPTGHILPVLTEEEANALAGATYTAGVPESAITYSADESPSDASYSFSYDAGDSSRSESADANLNVKGTFSFIPPDLGEKLTVNYIAGSETGFVAEGDHLPKPEDLGFGTKLTEIPEAPSAPAVPAKPAGTVLTYSAGDSPSDASYSFSYDAGSSSRSETSDSNLNIQGSYSFVAPDTEHRYNVKYHAGADTGFIAEGDHLPVAPEVPVIPPVPAVPEPVAPVVHSLYKAPEPAPQPASEVSEAIGAPAAITPVEVQSVHHPVGYTSHVVGDVLLHQYGVEYPDKYGYVFTAL
ncbi:uncharacterized protein LOC135102982 [Scylla paramamosain]|uniref:uncharacterized protein LOC135102982 n=1 Tax=Scylla paramamosain TaxID=85552 RepID=UPI003082A58F